MTKYSKQHNQSSKQTQEEAYKLALGIQKPGQTKEQTKLISQGIAKGIDLYKKQQKAKSREQDKQRKKQEREIAFETTQPESPTSKVVIRQHWLPWTLLIASWLGFGVYLAKF